jgi:peptide/nickel transport system substrate-binding protein
MMKRRFLALLASASVLAAAMLAAAPVQAQTKTLRVVAHADLKILDPTFTTAYISRNFGYMVYDTLFADDAEGHPKSQMVEKWTTSKDGLTWTFTLRPGLAHVRALEVPQERADQIVPVVDLAGGQMLEPRPG